MECSPLIWEKIFAFHIHYGKLSIHFESLFALFLRLNLFIRMHL